MSPGFLLLLAILFYLDREVGILPLGLLAAALHEGGHYAVGRAFGGRLRGLELSAVGAQMRLDYPAALSYHRELLVALAGPVANLLTAWLALERGWYLFAVVSLAIGGFNLLPVFPLDGGRVLWCALSGLLGTARAEQILPILAAVPVGVLTGLGVLALVRFSNLSLLVTALWLLWTTLGKRVGKK